MSDTAGIAKVSIPALKDSQNYAIWCVYLREILRREELETHLTDDPPNSEVASATVVNRWKKKDRSARSHIVLHLGRDATTNVTEILSTEATAKQVWLKLRDIYQKDNMQARLNLEAKLFSVKYKDGDNINLHIQDFERICVDLAALGDRLSDRQKVAHILRSLPSSLSNIATVAGALNLEYDAVISTIKAEIDRRDSKCGEEKKEDTQQVVTPGARKTTMMKPRHHNPKSKLECWYCGKPGHFESECRQKAKDRKRGRMRSRGRGRRFRGSDRSRYNKNDRNGFHNRDHFPAPSEHTYFQPPSSPGNQWGTGGAGSSEDRQKKDKEQKYPRGFMTRFRALGAQASRTKSSEIWIDSAANEHFFWDRAQFKSYTALPESSTEICEGSSIIVGEGIVHVPIGKQGIDMLVKHAPNFSENLISASKLSKLGYRLIIDEEPDFEGMTIIEKKSGEVVLKSPVTNGMYLVPQDCTRTAAARYTSTVIPAEYWHEVLGHIGRDRLLAASDAMIGVPFIQRRETTRHQCIPCIEAASRRAPVYSVNEQTNIPLALTHTDIAGPIDPPTLSMNKYMSAFLDQATKMSAVYFLKNRSEFPQSFTAYKALVENELKRRMYRVRMDRAGENTSTAVAKLSLEQGMLLEYSPPYASQSNGAAERLIQELWKMARTFLFASKLPHHLWAESISHSNWLRNRIPSTSINLNIPYEIWYGTKPNLSNILKFGQPGYSFDYIPDSAKGKKLRPRKLFSYFVGVESYERMYRVFVPSKQTVTLCRVSDFTILRDQDKLPSMTTLLEDLARKRELEEKENRPEAVEQTEETMIQCMYSAYTQIPISMKAKTKDPRLPRSFEEACAEPQWAAAIDREYRALEEMNSWKLIPFEPGMNPLPFIWTYRVKETPGAQVEVLHKARCCLRGDKQKAHRDFDPDSLYAPVARHETLRMLLAKTAAQNLLLEGADVSNAYLYGNLKKPVIMQQPSDSSGIPKKPGHVALLIKSLYGHREAGQIWGDVIHLTVCSWGFKQSSIDSRMYLLDTGYGFLILLIVVDDMALASNSRRLLEEVKEMLTKTFKVKLLGSLKNFIGWEILRTPSAIYVHQRKYIQTFCSALNLSHIKPQPTPLPITTDLSATHDTDIPLDDIKHAQYRSLVGGLMYIAVCTRPDISFAASVLARQVHAPSMRHYVLAKRVVRYLSGTINLALFYPQSRTLSEPLTGYSDSDWAGCRDTRKSTTGVIVTVNSAPIYWTSKRQSIVCLSSAEAEYVALSMCAKSITWLRRLFLEMATNKPCPDEARFLGTKIHTDNTAAISLSTNPQVSERNKHIELKVHHVRDLLSRGLVTLQYRQSSEQIADILTKALPVAQLQHLLRHVAVLLPKTERK